MGYAPEEYKLDISLDFDKDWLSYLLAEFDKPYMKKLYSFLENELGNFDESNIFKPFKDVPLSELTSVYIKEDYSYKPNIPGQLQLNPSLTRDFSDVNKHQKKGWEKFIAMSVKVANAQDRPLKFIFPKKCILVKLIDTDKHKVEIY